MDSSKFRQIIRKYRAGSATEEEKELIDRWYEEMGRQSMSAVNGSEFELENQYLEGLMDKMNRKKVAPFGKRHSRRVLVYVSGMAASILLVIATVFSFNTASTVEDDLLPVQPSSTVSWQRIENTTDAEESHTLPDGSQVTLKPQSSVKFSSLFNASVREIHLEGEGFFEVVPNKEKPFLVYANEVTTRVLGTSFTVRSYANDRNVTVAVKTGKVSVFASQEAIADDVAEIILTPNQEVTYDRAEKSVARRIVETPEPVISEEEIARIRFEEVPLAEVFEAIERIYAVEIEYEADLFEGCTITTSVNGGGLFNRMDIVTSAVGARYELEEDRIVVTGTGCK